VGWLKNKKYMAAMYSYPKRIPLPAAEVHRIKKKMLSYSLIQCLGFYDYQNIYLTQKVSLKTLCQNIKQHG